MRCKFYQWIIEGQLDAAGSVRKPRVLAHLKTCSACRQYHNQLVLMGKQLMSQSAGDLDDNRLRDLEEKIRHQLDRTLEQFGSRQQPSRSGSFLQMAAIAAGVMLVVLAGLLTKLHDAKPVQNDSTAQLSKQSQQQMQAEIRNLEMDTKNAINFLKEFAPFSPIELASIRNNQTPDEMVQ